MRKFKPHKIRNVDINICCKEQVAAYNYLFSWTLNDHDKSKALAYIQKELQAKNNGTYEEQYHPVHSYKRQNIDYDLVYILVLRHWDRYIENGKKIFSNYEDLGKMLYMEA